MDRAHFITAMVMETERGNYVDSGFKKVGWQNIVNDLNRLSAGNFTKQQCQSLCPKMKAEWTVYSAIIGNSGFGIDPITLAPTAPKSVWDTLILAHPTASQFRNKALRHFDELEIIFTGSSATGKFAKSPFMVLTPNHKRCRDSGNVGFSGEEERSSKKTKIMPAAYCMNPGADHASDDESSSDSAELPRQSIAKPSFHASNSAEEVSSIEDNEDLPKTTKAKPIPVKPLPMKSSSRKPRENAQDEVVKLLGKIVSNQELLVKHHTADSSLTRALAIFKEKYSAELSAADRFKFQKYLKDNSELFLHMEEDEMIACIDDCLN